MKTVDQFKAEVDVAGNDIDRLEELMGYVEDYKEQLSINDRLTMAEYIQDAFGVVLRQAQAKLIDDAFELAKLTAGDTPRPY